MLAGKKTYIVAAVMVGVVVAQAFGLEIPDNVWHILEALGLGALRLGVKKGEVGGGLL